MEVVKIAIVEKAVAEALAGETGVEAVICKNLTEAAEAVCQGRADSLLSGVDFSSREVILAVRDGIGVEGEGKRTFSASFWLKREDAEFVIGDAAACKHPTEEQLYDIILQTYETGKVLLKEEPRVAILSWSTLGSGGKDEETAKLQRVIEKVRKTRPEVKIDGEMQLDAAVSEAVGRKKAPGSEVAGRANVLILPDLNSGNILYKAMEQFGGFTAAGPLLQGFKVPAADLSRGSNREDIILTAQALEELVRARGKDRER